MSALPSELKDRHLRRVLITISCGEARFEELKIETAAPIDEEGEKTWVM